MVNAMGLPFDLIDNVFCYISEPSDWFSLSLIDSEWNYISKKYRRQMLLVKFTGTTREDDVDWVDISKNKQLSKLFIREFANKVNWYWISSSCQKLSEPFIREFANNVDWKYISSCQKLSEPFIREFANQVDWKNISSYQKLSEPFIREFANQVDWWWISYYQKLSEKFLYEFANKINWAKTVNAKNN